MSSSTEADWRRRFAAARVAHLASADAHGAPHVVPVTFAVEGDVIWTAVDHKPKRTRALKRLANIEANPRVALLADHYCDDWSELWWVRADGGARIFETPSPEALAALTARYDQYAERPPEGPAIAVTVERWSGWSAAG
jgi:PPOX class probable F420-dependent enzyme